MKRLMEEIFNGLKYIYPDYKVIGKDAMVSFDKDRYAKIRFTKYATHGTPNSNVFNGVVIDMMDRTKGSLDSQMIAFSDVFDSIIDLNHPNKIGKHIWNDGNKYRWYGKPTEEDLDKLFNTVADFLQFAQGREAHDRMLSAMDKGNNDIKVVIDGGMVSSVFTNSQKEWNVELIDFDGIFDKKSEEELEAYVDSLKMDSDYKELMYSSYSPERNAKEKNSSLDEKLSDASTKLKSVWESEHKKDKNERVK